jgi:hypothetical protein
MEPFKPGGIVIPAHRSCSPIVECIPNMRTLRLRTSLGTLSNTDSQVGNCIKLYSLGLCKTCIVYEYAVSEVKVVLLKHEK